MPARVAKTSKPIRDGSNRIAAVSSAGGAPINTSRVRKDPKGVVRPPHAEPAKAGDPWRVIPFLGSGCEGTAIGSSLNRRNR
jgi:hypothetical protein